MNTNEEQMTEFYSVLSYNFESNVGQNSVMITPR